MTEVLPVTLSLRDLLSRVSSHLDGLAAEVHAIEHAIGDEMGVSVAQGAQTITRLQRLDFLRQSLEDMALLSHFLSTKHDGVLDSNLAKKLRLDVTKNLVNGGADTAAVLPHETVIGDVDLF